jgi:sugar lactone lactonase YvrE
MNKKLKFWGSAGIFFAVLMLIVGGSWKIVSAQSHAGTVQVPKLEVDPNWPKPLPNGWVYGQVSSAAGDADGNIWVLHRPSGVRPNQKSAPPVLEFDQAGNLLKSWGGTEMAQAQGFVWPESEHGIYIDYKGFVWIGGNGNDDEIYKFTKDGKLVMQIGKPQKKKSNQDTTQFWRPADVFVYPKTNELFVADGYGNKRVIVFDADTGVYKRMWGAFGNAPEDPAPRARGGDGGEGGPAPRQAPDPNRIPAKELPDSDQGPPQFNTVHSVKVSNDGLVYVSDRGGKRVQIFTTDGKYIQQVWIDRWCEAIGQGCGNGQTVASTAFSADPEQRFLYVASRSPARIWIYDRKTMKPLDSFGRPGVAPGEFDVLHHMTTDQKGNLYTSEVEDGHRIQKFVYKGLVTIPAK